MDAPDPEGTSGLSVRSARGNAGRNKIGAAPLAARSAKLQRAHAAQQEDSMAAPEEIDADVLAFWNGKGGHTWVARQEHTDITLKPGDGRLARLCCTTRQPTPKFGCRNLRNVLRACLPRFQQAPTIVSHPS
jgi:hypothetical protein